MDSDAMLENQHKGAKGAGKEQLCTASSCCSSFWRPQKQNEDDKHLNLTSFEIRTDGADVREAVFGICAEKKFGLFMR